MNGFVFEIFKGRFLSQLSENLYLCSVIKKLNNNGFTYL